MSMRQNSLRQCPAGALMICSSKNSEKMCVKIPHYCLPLFRDEDRGASEMNIFFWHLCHIYRHAMDIKIDIKIDNKM